LFFFSAPSSEYQRNHLFCIKTNYGEIWQARHRDGAACTAKPHARPTVAGTIGRPDRSFSGTARHVVEIQRRNVLARSLLNI